MKRVTLPSLFLLICIFSSCIARNMTFGNGKDWIPAEFNAKTDILMIEASLPLKGQDRRMEEYMKAHYPYKFEFVRYRDIMDREDKFADAKLYRFVFMYEPSKVYNGQGYSSAMDWYFYDRMKDKRNPPTSKGSFSRIVTFKGAVNTIIQDAGK